MFGGQRAIAPAPCDQAKAAPGGAHVRLGVERLPTMRLGLIEAPQFAQFLGGVAKVPRILGIARESLLKMAQRSGAVATLTGDQRQTAPWPRYALMMLGKIKKNRLGLVEAPEFPQFMTEFTGQPDLFRRQRDRRAKTLQNRSAIALLSGFLREGG